MTTTVQVRHSRLGGPEAWLVWVLATTFVVWLFAIQTGYAVVSPQIQQTAGLSIAQVGLAASVYTWVFAAAQFFSGPLLDHFGTRPLLAIAVTLVTAGAFLYAASTSFATLALAQLVLAVGASFGFVGAGYVGGRWFEAAKYGLMFGLVQSFASLGSALGQPLILATLDHLAWQDLLVAFGSFGVLLAILFLAFVRDPHTSPDTATQRRRGVIRPILLSLKDALSNPRVLLSAVLSAASFGTMLAVGTLWGPRLIGARGVDPTVATWLTALAWLGLAVGAPLVNIVSNRWGSRRRPAVIALLLQGAAIAGVIYLPDAGTGVAIVLMFAMGLFSGAQMLGFTISGESVDPRLIGSAAAIVNGACFLLSGVLTSVPGAFLPASPDIADFQAVLWIMPLVLVIGAVAASSLRDRPPVRPTSSPSTETETP